MRITKRLLRQIIREEIGSSLDSIRFVPHTKYPNDKLVATVEVFDGDESIGWAIAESLYVKNLADQCRMAYEKLGPGKLFKVSSVSINSSYRGKGIGFELYKQVMKQARKNVGQPVVFVADICDARGGHGTSGRAEAVWKRFLDDPDPEFESAWGDIHYRGRFTRTEGVAVRLA